MKARLYLEDGTLFEGESFGATATVYGEVVFNTGMTGYQEILTDPSYRGQMVTMTYPLIGNYGINDEDFESDFAQVSAFIVREHSNPPNHWQSKMSLDQYLKEKGIPGISGIDTRKLTKIIRSQGSMNGVLTTEEVTDAVKDSLKAYKFPQDLVAKVSCGGMTVHSGTGLKIGLVDLGLKKGIVKQLTNLDCHVVVYPHNVDVTTIEGAGLDVLMFSNGPGDPKDAKAAIALAESMVGKLPMWGICLGHQILGLALGADTYKLKFGHRGANHPVIELNTEKVFMSSQNHGYAVDGHNMPGTLEVTYLNVNDETVEGICHKGYKVQSVQFHPEEGPGPEDAHYIFKQWVENFGKGGGNNA